jgi:NADPH:quinone reductase-like Zn-dependent oxidoreductase
MRAVQLRAYDGSPESIAVVELPVPRPGPGQVLIRVAASPINPSDLMFIRVFMALRNLFPRFPDLKAAARSPKPEAG